MEEKKKNGSNKRKENPVREWISDNLRYLILIGIIAIIVIVVLAFIGSLSDGADGGASDSSSELSSLSIDSEVNDGSDTSEESDSSSQIEADESSEDEEQNETDGLITAEAEISELVTSYFDALASCDADAVAAVVEELDDETRSAISSGLFADTYTNITVYSYSCAAEGTYVVFAEYDYTYDGYDTVLPALTQLYVFTSDDGTLLIASEEREQENQTYIDEVLEDEEVLALIDSVREEYEAALASDSALSAYIDSFSS